MNRLMLTFIVGALAAIGAMTGPSAHAQSFPTKPVTLIVPWPAGGSSDLALRAFADAAQKHLGQQLIIENRPGASGTLGPAQMAATAKPDGYTLSQMPITVFRLPYMTKKTFKELIDDAKANPGKIKYGTPGTGTSLHIGMEQIAKQTGAKWTQVPFKGAAETNAALLGGHVDAVADSTGWRALVESGDFRLLVTWGADRTKNWPDVPTLKELGINLVANSPYGIAGPKGIDPKIAQVLHDAFAKAVKEPVYLESLKKFDQELAYLNTADYEKHAVEQIEEAKKLVADLGLKTN